MTRSPTGDDPDRGARTKRDVGPTVETDAVPQTPTGPPAGGAHSSLDRTLDMPAPLAGPAPPAGPAPRTVPHASLARTLDAAEELPAAASARGPQSSATAALPPDADEITAQVTRLWGEELEHARPRMTLKGRQVQTVASGMSLVIQPRAFRSLQDAPAAPDSAARADYDLISLLGAGGMGVVYQARQASVDRTVAIKMLRSGAVGDERQRQKFLSEAVVTGDLDHPNIVPIYELGADDRGALFYSMKRVQGTPWEQKLLSLPQSENIEILMKVADAVAFAHARGVIHRDLKPENVMLGDFGEVLVMDWGLALPTAQFGKSNNVPAVLGLGGSPAYMAPEMATGPLKRITFASDVYLLGAILYEIVTGSPPHAGPDVKQCLAAAARNIITPPQQKGELVDIALRALATDPADRYASVRDFQNAIRQCLAHAESIALAARAEEDLASAEQSGVYDTFAQSLFGFREGIRFWDGNRRAHLGLTRARLAYARTAWRKGDYDLGASLLDPQDPAHQPVLHEIQAAQQERDTRQRRLRRARRAVAALIAVVFLVVTTAFLLVNQQRQIAERERTWAEDARDEAKEQQRIAEEAERQERQARQAADAAKAREKVAREAAERSREAALAAQGKEAKARRAAEQAEQAALAAKKLEEEARKLEEKARTEAEYEAYIAKIGLAAAKIEENAFDAARELLEECPAELRNWEWERLRFLCERATRTYTAGQRIEALTLSADGQRLFCGGWNGIARIWPLDAADQARDLPHAPTSVVQAVAFSPDGRLAATGSNDRAGGYLRLWEVATGRLLKRLEGHTDAVSSLTFSHDGQRLLSSSFDNTARLWNVASGQALRVFAGHDWWVWAAAFAPPVAGQEQEIVTASQDGTALVWPVAEGATLPVPFLGHRRGRKQTPVYAAAFSPDGQRVATGGLDGRVLIWTPRTLKPFDYQRAIADVDPPSPEQKHLELDKHRAAVRSLAFSRDGRRLISGSQDNTVMLWDATTGQLIKTFRGHDGWVRACSFSPDGRFVFSGSHDGTAKIWNVADYEEIRVLRGRVLDEHEDAVLAASFDRDGRRIVTASRDRSAKTWDAATGRELRTFREGHTFTASTAVFFPDGKHLLTSAVDNTARVWDVASGGELPHLRLDRTGRHGAVALSADGRWILTGGDHGDPERTAPAEPVRAEPSAVGTAPAPSLRDRLRAATEAALARWAAQLWDADTGRRLHLLPGHKEEVTAVAIAPDGRLLFTGDRNGRCALWDRESGRELRRFWDDGQVNAAAFLPDGKRLLTASTHAVVRQWSVDTGDEVPALTLRHPDGVVGLALSRDGTRLLTSCADGRVRVWDPTRAVEVITLNARGGRTAFIQNLRRLLGDVGARGAEWNESRLAQATQLPEARVAELLAGTGEALSQELDGLARVFAVSPDALWKTTFTVAIAADGATGLTVAADDRIVRLWNLADGREIRFPATDQQLGPFLDFNGPVHRGLVWAAGFSPAGDRVVTVGGDSARLWDARLNIAAQQRELMSFSPHTTVAAAEFSPDGKLLVTGSWDNSVRIWDAQSGQALHKLGTALGQPQEEHRGKVNSATFAPDGGLVLTASDDATAKLWSTRDWSLVRTLRGHTGGVLHAAFARDGRRIVTASRDETARLWDVKSGQELAVLSGHRGLVMQAVFSDDGNWLATGSADHSAQIWELDGTTATPVHTLKGHTASVTAVAFSPDASRVLTGSEDYTVKLWDAHAGREILTLSGHTQGVTSVAFSPSGHEALTASRDGTAILWLTQDQRQP